MSQYTISNNTNSFSNVLNNYIIADDWSHLLRCLSPREPGYCISEFKSALWGISGNGSCKLGSSEGSAAWVGKVEVIRQFCFAMDIRGLVRHLSGNQGYSGREESEPLLTTSDHSSLGRQSLGSGQGTKYRRSMCLSYDIIPRSLNLSLSPYPLIPSI